MSVVVRHRRDKLWVPSRRPASSPATDRAELKQVAAPIIEAQQRVIDQMQGWLVAWYPSGPPARTRY